MKFKFNPLTSQFEIKEDSLTASNIVFDNTDTDLVATTVQDAIVEVNSKIGFHYKNIVAGKTVTIPVDMQMTVKQHLKIRGQLIVRGELVII